MKQNRLIFMAIQNPGTCIYSNRNEWTLERITAPRPSCLSSWKVRNELRELAPGATTTINGIEVRRKALTHQAARYQIAGKWHKITEAIAAVEAGKAKVA